MLTLYACCYVNFAHVIARTNLALYREGTGVDIDADYLCDLGQNAAGALRDYQAETGVDPCAYREAVGTRLNPLWPDGWRDWGFRSWRVQRYLTTSLPAPKP